MADKILHKRSLTQGSVPSTSNLEIGELAMNVNDGKVFMRKSGSGIDTVTALVSMNSTSSGSLSISGSITVTGSILHLGDYLHTGSVYHSGSKYLVGQLVQTGSLEISGSTTQIGNNTLRGNTFLTGSITVSGSFPVGSPSASLNIHGNTTHDGYIRFNPVTTNLNSSLSASYIYVSGSTNDLYFTQNGEGYSNTTRLRWLEGNLYTGLLHGGLITTASSTTFNISSGSGIVVNLNASLNKNPYPTITYVNWGNLTNQSLTYRTTNIQTFVGIDSNGGIVQQTTPWNDGQYNTSISIGTVIHQNLSTINATITYPNVAYGYKQRTYDFVKAFGPLRLSGLQIQTSSSLGLVVTSGTAFADGRNYQVDPNNPSYITDSGTAVSKIFRYYASASTFVQDTNGGAGYTDIDPNNYNVNGTGVLASVGGSYSIQRVFWYPNSATKGIVVYYGNALYATIREAIDNINIEQFYETANTQQNAVYIGSVIIKGSADFSSTSNYQIVPAGLFRSIGGSGGGGTVPTTRLSDLSDVTISTPTDGQALVYDTVLQKWKNASSISASISGNASTSTTSSFSYTASYAPNYTLTSVTGSMTVLSSSYSYTSSYSPNYVLNSLTSSFATTGSNTFRGTQIISGSIVLPQLTSQVNKYVVGYDTASGQLYYQITSSGGGSGTPGGSSGQIQYNNAGAFDGVSSLVYVGGQLSATGSFSGPLQGTSSWASNSVTASYAGAYVLNSVTSSMLSGYVLNSATSSGTVLSSSYAQTASLAPNYVLTSATSSMLSSYTLNSATSSGTVLSSSYAQTASYAPLYLPLAGGTINGNITVNGTASIAYLNVTFESSSVIYSSGSNQFGDASNDTQTLYGTVNIPAGTLIVTGSVTSTVGFTGSLQGTSSFATNSSTSSYAPNYVLNSVTSSMLSPYALNSSTSSATVLSSSYAQTASYAPNYVLTSVTQSMLSAYTLNSATSSGTVLSSSYAQTASYAPSYVLNSTTSSMLSPYTLNSATSSGTVLSSSYAQTSSLSFRVSGSMTGSLLGSASYATTASYALNGGVTQIVAGTNVTISPTNGLGAVTINSSGGGASFPYTGSAVITGSLIVTGSTVSTLGFTGSLLGTSSWANNVVSASYAATSSYSNGFTINADVFVFTGSMYMSGSTYQTGSINVRGGITGSLLGTASYALTASYAMNGGGSSTITVADEGTAQGTATFLNFIGTGVTATVSAGTGSITIAGGGGLSIKSGTASNAAFTGNPKKATVTFGSAFGSTNYAVTVTGEDARSWTIESKVAGSFVINSNSNATVAGTTYWHAIAYGES